MVTARTALSLTLTRLVTAWVMLAKASAAVPKYCTSCQNHSPSAAAMPPSAAAPVPTVRPSQRRAAGRFRSTQRDCMSAQQSGISHKIKKVETNSNPHMQRMSTASATSPKHQPDVRPLRTATRQSSSDASTGSSQVHRHQYRSFIPRWGQGANTTANTQTSAAAGPACRQAASASSSSAA